MHAAEEGDPIVHLPGPSPAWDLPDPRRQPQDAASAALRALVDMSGLDPEEWAAEARKAAGMGYVTPALVDHWTAEPTRVLAGSEVFVFALALAGRAGLAVLASMLPD